MQLHGYHVFLLFGVEAKSKKKNQKLCALCVSAVSFFDPLGFRIN
jgi:hypothetical protein